MGEVAVDDRAIERALLTGGPSLKRRRAGLLRGGAIFTLVAAVIAAGWLGVTIRNWTFTATEPVRMWYDIVNGFERGGKVVHEARLVAQLEAAASPLGRLWNGRPAELSWGQFWNGYLGFYDNVAARARPRRDALRYDLDYAPLRLLIMSAWVKHTLDRHPNAGDYQNPYAWPLMHFNTAMAAAGAVTMFFAVWAWRRRCDLAAAMTPGRRYVLMRGEPVFSPGLRTAAVAVLAAVILFLNPATIINSHGFVQWDTWIVPFYLAAIGLAAIGRWGWAGLALGASLGFKGQTLLVLPAVVLFPIFAGSLSGALRFATGFAFAWIAIGLPWLVPSRRAWLWLGTTAVLAAAFAWQDHPRRIGLSWWLAAGLTTALAVGPFMNEQYVWRIWIPLALVAGMILLPWMLPRGNGGAIWGIVAIAAIVATADRFAGSWNWFTISYVWPSYQYKQMIMGPVSNLPAILAQFGWGLDSVVFSGRLAGTPFALELRTALAGLAFTLVGLCGIAAAIQQRRRDPALLIALTAPWVIAFALLPQMHERYLTWAAAVCGVGFAVSVGMGLMHWVIAGLSFTMTFHQMIRMHSGDWPNLLPVLDRLQPHLGWMLLLAAAVYLYAAFAPSRRSP